MMQDLSDAFVVMPGDLRTLKEAIETWNANMNESYYTDWHNIYFQIHTHP